MKSHSRRRLLGLSVALTALVAATVFSTTGSAARQAAPTNTTEPRILGTARIGATLTANRGIWTGDPSSYRYQWVRCSESGGRPDGSNCPAIRGATDQQLGPARNRQRRAQFLLDFVEAENSMGFHADQEAVRVLSLSIDESRRGQAALPGSVATQGAVTQQ